MKKTLNPIISNAGLQAFYRKRLQQELKVLQKSLAKWLQENYKKNEADIVGDARPFGILNTFKRYVDSWLIRWNIFGDWLSDKVIDRANKQTMTSLRNAFIGAGFTVKFNAKKELTPKIRRLISDNATLIKDIPKRYLSEVEEIITKGLSTGHDYAYVTEKIGERFNITKHRASFIARDQIDKATQQIQLEKHKELGIREGIWVHRPGQFTSRKSHVKMDGKTFNLDEGMFDEEVNQYVKPGELFLCRCTYRAVVPAWQENYNGN